MQHFLFSVSVGVLSCAIVFSPAFADEALDKRIDAAIAQLEPHIEALMDSTGIPGLAVAVVRDGETVLARGYGVRSVETNEPLTPDTVFQLASVSKSIGASVVAHVVGQRKVNWDTRIQDVLPWFRLGDAWVSGNVTIGDLYAHRSGLPDHAGDDLEQLDYSQREIFERLQHLPLAPFRSSYAYTNYGVTLAAEAAAAAAGQDWASLSETALYQPLGMNSTSSRFADFVANSNHAIGHVREEGRYLPSFEGNARGLSRWSTAVNADRTSAAAGVSSSASDMARWMAFLLDQGRAAEADIPGSALASALTPKSIMTESRSPGQSGSFYGYGFMITSPVPGHVVFSHSGAFAWGASTMFALIPEADVGIVVLVNATPNGVSETIVAQFNDIVLTGAPTQDWETIYRDAFAAVLAPQGRLVKAERPEPARPPRPLADYAGSYQSDYFGPLEVAVAPNDTLLLKLGLDGKVEFTARHWDADTFAYAPFNDAQMLGSVSAVDFFADSVVLEYFDGSGHGQFTRSAAD